MTTIIGITGTLGAGKGAVVSYLVHHKGFVHYSARTLFQTQMEAAGIIVNRDSMVAFANECRARYGAGYVFNELWREAKTSGKPSIIESIRTVGEANALKENGGILLSVDADVQKRFERIHGRGSVLDQVSFEQFQEQESREMHSDDPNKQNIGAVMRLADYAIENNGSVPELHKKIKEVLKSIEERELQQKPAQQRASSQ